MENRGILTKILAIIGTALVWFPLLAPVLLSAAAFLIRGMFRFDYLLTAELFPVTLVGVALLIWAAIRARSHLKLIAWSLGIAVAFLVIGQGVAMITGLASGETEPGGWQWMLVLATIAGYGMALVATGVGGIWLLRDLFKTSGLPTASL